MEHRTVSSQIEDVIDLAPQQEGMVFHELAGDGLSPYVVQQVFLAKDRSGQPLSLDTVKTAVAALSHRHSILRTSIVTQGLARPRQVVLSQREPTFTVVDLRGRHDGVREEIDRLLTEDVARGFRLDTDPLLRVTAVRTSHASGEELRLVWTYHHVIMDGWSLAQLFADFRRYAAHAEKATPEEVWAQARREAQGRPRYSDYVSWVAARDEDAFDRYWADVLDGVDAPARLVSVMNEQHASSTRGSRYAYTTSTALGSRLVSRHASQGLTLAHLVESALAIVLSRLTGQDDVVLGKVVSGRDADVAGLADLVGLFVNTVPVRARVRGDEHVSALLSRTRAQALATSAHAHGSLARIQSLTGHRELFECLLAVENIALDDNDLHDAGMYLEQAREETGYPLTVTVQPVGDELRLIVLVDPTRLAHEDARLVAGRLVQVLESIAAANDPVVADIESIDEKERAHVLRFTTTSQRPLQARTIGEAFERAAARHASRTAVIDRGRRVTYAELEDLAHRIRTRLEDSGVRHGNRVGIIGSATTELIASMLAITQVGAVYVPIDISAPPRRQSMVVRDASLSHVVRTDASATPPTDEWDPLLRARLVIIDATEVTSRDPAPASSSRARLDDPESPAYIMYTSGTTGRPKGAVIPHRAVLRLVLGNASLPLTADDRLLLTGSVAFDASTFEIYGALLNGGSLVLVDKSALLDTVLLAKHIREYAVTLMWLTVSLFNHIISTSPGALDGLARVIIGGEAVQAGHVRRLYRENPTIKVINGYGPTENTTFTTVHPFPRDFHRVVIGRPIGNTRTRVIRDGERICGVGEVGELVVGGDGVALGYLAAPEATAQSFFQAPEGLEYRTGDRARWLVDGTIEYLGRIGEDRQVKIRGYRVEIDEVEAVLRELDGVSDVVVTVRRDDDGPAQLHAYIVTEGTDGESGTIKSVRRQAGDVLPNYMVPARMTQVNAIPLTPNGKLDTRALAALDTEEQSEHYAPEAPATPAEIAVAEAFSRVLSATDVGRSDSFFELGGDSITAIRVVSAVRKAGYQCSVSRIMQSMTVKDIARHIEQTSRAVVPTRSAEGPVGRLPMVEELLSWNLAAPAHFNQDVVINVGHRAAQHVREAFDAVWTHHDGLRAVLKGEELVIRSVGREGYGFTQKQVTSAEKVPDALNDLAYQLQAGMDLEAGPLVQVGLVQSPAGSTLLVCAHHLVVDIVSWHIIVEDFLTALDAAHSHTEIVLPPASASLQQWTAALEELASQLPPAEQEHWDRVDSMINERTDESCCREVVQDIPATGLPPVILSVEETTLIKRVSHTYGATVEDLLLAGIALAMQSVTGQRSVVVQREGHGRPEHELLPDVSRTVGWFTAIHPVVIDCFPDSPHRSIIAAKEAIRSIPLGGIGYALRAGAPAHRPRPEIAVNYVGEQDSAQTDEVGAYSLNSAGHASAPTNHLPVAAQVDALITGSRLHVFASVAPTGASAAVVRAVRSLREHLLELAAHAHHMSARVLTPSDFPLADRLTSEDMETVLRRYGDVEDIIDLTALQQGILSHHVHSPDSRAYTVQQVFKVGEALQRGRSDSPGSMPAADVVTRVREALRILSQRHPVLRTRFAWSGLERPRQVVLLGATAGWQEVTVSTDWPTRLDDVLSKEVARGFDLSTDPLLRVTLVHDGSEGSSTLTLVWTYHHIILDGWSLSVLLNEFIALLRGEPLAERGPRSRRVFGEFIASGARQSPEASDTYWTRLLEGYDSTWRVHTALPSTGAPAEAPAVTRARHESHGRLAARLVARHATAGTTLAHLVQTALALTLGRACDVDDVVIGKVVSGRDTAVDGAETATGLFINTVPARVRWRLEQPVQDLLDDVRAQAVASAAFEHTSLARIQDLVDNRALITCLFAFENYGLDSHVLDEAGLAFVQGREETTYPLTLTAQQSGDEILLVWLYDAADLGSDDLRRLSDRIFHILDALSGDTLTSVGELVSTPSRLLQGLPRDASPGIVTQLPRSLGEAFVSVVTAAPDAVAFREDGTSVTYRRLLGRASAVARDLQAAGVAAGDRVGLAAQTSAAAVTAILGIVLAGGSYVPIDVSAPYSRTRLILDDADVRVVLAVGEAGRCLLGQAALKADVITTAADREDEPCPPVARTHDDEAYVMYTSGTAGRPRGVMVPHRAVLRIAVDSAAIPITPDDSVLAACSIALDASTLELWAPILRGGTIVFSGRDTPLDDAALNALVDRDGVTAMFITASLLNTLVGSDPQGLSRLRVVTAVMTDDDPVVAACLRQLYETSTAVRLFQVYGPTEDTAFTTSYPVPRAIPRSRAVPIGSPTAGAGVRVLDQHGSECGPGEQGELTVTGPGLALGYLGMPRLTAERFPLLPTAEVTGFRTGDRGQWLVDGTLVLLGRVSERAQAKIQGFHVETGEVEAAIRAVDGVTDAVVISASKPGETESLTGYYVASDDVTARRLREALRTNLPDYMMPRHLVALPVIPLSLSGKPDIGALPAPGTPQEGSAEKASARDDIEESIATVWMQVLGVKSVGDDDSFFELGGNSLNIIQVKGHLDRIFPGSVTIGDLFSFPHVPSLAQVIRAASRSRVVIEKVEVSGTSTITPLAGRVLLRGSWDARKKARAVYAFMLALSIAADQDVKHVLVEDDDGPRSLSVPDGPDHLTNLHLVEQSLKDTLAITAQTAVRVEGSGQLIALRLPSADSSAPAHSTDDVDVFITINDDKDTGAVNLALSPRGPHVDQAPATLVATRYAPLLEGLLLDDE